MNEISNELFNNSGFRQSKSSTIRLVLVKRDSDRWAIYFGQIIFHKQKKLEESKELFKSDNLIIFELVCNSESARTFLISQEEKETYFLNGHFNNITIDSKGSVSEKYYVYGEEKSLFRVEFPCQRFVAHFTNHPDLNKINLASYRHVHELILDELGIDLNKYNGLPNTLNVLLETSLDRINEVQFDESTRNLYVKIDYDAKKQQSYELIIFADIYGGRKFKKHLPISGAEISYELEFEPDSYEIRLKCDNDIMDKWIHHRNNLVNAYNNLNNGTANDNPFYSYLTSWKKNVLSEKSKLTLPDGVNFGGWCENNLIEAEKCSDANQIVQLVAEGMENLCKELANLYSIPIKKKDNKEKSGLTLHEVIVAFWQKNTSLPREHLVHQTGLRHIFYLCNIKKHKKYKPFIQEAQYCILLAWRAYFGIIKMAVEIQSNQKNT